MLLLTMNKLKKTMLRAVAAVGSKKLFYVILFNKKFRMLLMKNGN